MTFYSRKLNREDLDKSHKSLLVEIDKLVYINLNKNQKIIKTPQLIEKHEVQVPVYFW